MDAENREGLEDRLAELRVLVTQYEPGTDEYKDIKDEIRMIGNLLNDEDKLAFEEKRLTYESMKDAAQEKESRATRIWRGIGDGLKVVGGLVSTYVGYRAFKIALGFESGGTFRSKAGLQALNRILSGKF